MPLRKTAGRAKRRLRDQYRDAAGLVERKRERSNPLETYFRNNTERRIYKWLHYFDIYDRHFARYRGKPIKVLEFGISRGGSLQMWKSYFGHRARIVGVDIEPRCKEFEEERIKVALGDQEDRGFLRRLVKAHGPFDVVIEDGGHTMGQQIATFEEIWPAVADGGVFLIEDLHTSYWPKYGGGYRKPDTFIEYAKNLVDQQHAWHARDIEGFEVDEYTRTIRGMHVYDSIIVFDKGTVAKPRAEKTGFEAF